MPHRQDIAVVGHALCDIIFSSSSSSDSEEEDLELWRHIVHSVKSKPSRVQYFIERTIPGFTAKEFQSHFRISREAFEWLMQRIAPALEKRPYSVGKHRISTDRQLLSSLWILATPDSFRSIGMQFNMGKSSLFVSFLRVINALVNIAPQVIKWPNLEERILIKEKFRRFAGLEEVIGAIDGTFVPIKAPRENPDVYINRKAFHAMTLQAICTPMLSFTDCFTGYPSSVNDARIFRNSDIFEQFLDNNANYFEDREYIIGDKAYPVFKWCIPPYINRGNLQVHQTVFNTVHAKTRQCVERSFALLFGRLRRLRYLDMNRIDLVPKVIIASCVIHNICLLTPDELLEEYIAEGRPYVQNDNNNEEIMDEIIHNVRNEGEFRRNELAVLAYERHRRNRR